VLMTSLTAL